MVSNCGNLIIPLDMLLTKWPWCSDWQDRLLASPRFHAKNKHHPQSDETNWHPSPWLLSQLFLKWTLWKFGNLHKSADFFLFRSTKSWIDEPQCNSQFLAMVTQMKHLFFFFYVMQNKFSIRHVSLIMHEPWQSLQLQFCKDFNYLRVVLIVCYKHMNFIIYFNPGVTQWLPLSLPCHSTFPQRCLLSAAPYMFDSST